VTGPVEKTMANINVMLVHGAWADGSSWARVITALKSDAVNVIAVPLPLTSLADDARRMGQKRSVLPAAGRRGI
jgi:hypothetical protein